MCLLNCTENQTSVNSTQVWNCELYPESTSVKCIKALAYSLIMIISLCGNLAVIAIVLKNIRMWTTTNFLIANMAASDLLISVFAVPRELVQIFTGPRRWLLDGLTGLILCKLVYFFQDISAAVSIQSLVVIAIDRYRGVVFPFRPPLITARVCRVIIAIIWIVAMCIHGTYFYTVRLTMQDNKWYCTFSWESKFDPHRTQERYFVFISVFLIFLPLSVILTLYALILMELKKRNLDEGRTLRRQRQREDTAIVKKILIIVFLFVFCITPVTVLALVYYFAWNWHLPCGMDKLFSALRFIFFSNASLNPCVYISLSERYRQGLKDLINCLWSRRFHTNEIELNVPSTTRSTSRQLTQQTWWQLKNCKDKRFKLLPFLEC